MSYVFSQNFVNKVDLKTTKFVNKIKILAAKTINAAAGDNAVWFHFAVAVAASDRIRVPGFANAS